jgi:NAD(P)-dependent dehydrogenase (short-subunit alcohol dehydrogenase family)
VPQESNGKVAVVTGGAAGIGQAFATRLAADGFDVVIADLGDASDTVAAVSALGRRAAAYTCDVSSADSVAEFSKSAVDDFGRIDVLVNNAGIYPATAFLDMSWEEWQRVININVNSLFHTAKAALPGMVERGWGRIISVSSTTFHSGIPFNTHYTASKGAVIGFTRSLAAEVGEHGVTVNSIAPGLVRTATTSTGPQAQMFDVLAQQQAIKRTQEPADLVGACSFLASADSDFITGQTLCVDGGWVRA